MRRHAVHETVDDIRHGDAVTSERLLAARAGADREGDRARTAKPARLLAWTSSIAVHGGLVLGLLLLPGTSLSWRSLPGGGGDPGSIDGQADEPLLVSFAREDVVTWIAQDLPRGEVG